MFREVFFIEDRNIGCYQCTAEYSMAAKDMRNIENKRDILSIELKAGNISCLQLNGKNIPFIFYIAHIFCRHTILCCALITTNISIFNKKDFTEHPKSLYPQEPGSAGSLKRSVIWLSLSRFKTSPHIRPSPLDNMYKIF